MGLCPLLHHIGGEMSLLLANFLSTRDARQGGGFEKEKKCSENWENICRRREACGKWRGLVLFCILFEALFAVFTKEVLFMLTNVSLLNYIWISLSTCTYHFKANLVLHAMSRTDLKLVSLYPTHPSWNVCELVSFDYFFLCCHRSHTSCPKNHILHSLHTFVPLWLLYKYWCKRKWMPLPNNDIHLLRCGKLGVSKGMCCFAYRLF